MLCYWYRTGEAAQTDESLRNYFFKPEENQCLEISRKTDFSQQSIQEPTFLVT
jgi:hypothetical protein